MNEHLPHPVSVTNLLEAMATIVAGFAAKVALTPDELGKTILSVFQTLERLSGAHARAPLPVLIPQVPIKKSVTADFIICLEDGKKFRMLKRHLRSAYSLTPAAYRAKWNLPAAYPMVAPKYAAFRSRMAKKSGLGQPARLKAA